MSSRSSKLIAIALIAVVVTAGAGYWLLVAKTPSETASHTTQQTLPLISSAQTSVVTPSEQTQPTSTSLTTVTSTSATTVWINISAAKPVNYYLKLLESNRTQPYVQLAKELRKIPDLTNATAVAKITYLALNATNPEVKEAFELIIKGGTPSPSDFQYNVPNYNTELLQLCHLAEDNRLEKDDTTALAISMTSGLFVTMGDEQVRRQVRIDNNEMLNLAREITEWQTSNGYFPLRNAPLEAKLAWAWRGSENVGYKLMNLRDERKHIDEAVYSSMAVSVSALREMRQFVTKEWLSPETDQTIERMENLYIILPRVGDTPTWTLGEESDRGLLNANYVWQYFRTHGKGIGVCIDEATFVDALAKSVGIPTIPVEVGGTRRDNSKIEAHAFVLYYNPESRVWRSYREQVMVPSNAYKPPYWVDFYLPPVRQTALLWSRDPEAGSPPMFAIAGYRPTVVNIGALDCLIDGVPTSRLLATIMLPFYLDATSVIAFSESFGRDMSIMISTDEEDSVG